MPMSSTLDQDFLTTRWLHQNGTEVKHSLETQNPIGSTFITIGIQRSQCRPNVSCNQVLPSSLTLIVIKLRLEAY
ncbi:hypothetical protein IGI04_036570 [Brassica rapa subsp. trilocularis]|uniref:Uncharacterized protein n=1 Tax=Brassica rapa subsp. trilocularis TaxID=1813537 RepID=A0ABQ7LGN1_BRACM|nr:hypothetical protein IGI04_036570 [Brassica rapa subsp. trilocularis]